MDIQFVLYRHGHRQPFYRYRHVALLQVYTQPVYRYRQPFYRYRHRQPFYRYRHGQSQPLYRKKGCPYTGMGKQTLYRHINKQTLCRRRNREPSTGTETKFVQTTLNPYTEHSQLLYKRRQHLYEHRQLYRYRYSTLIQIQKQTTLVKTDYPHTGREIDNPYADTNNPYTGVEIENPYTET